MLILCYSFPIDGYDHDAVPYDYLEQAPSDIEVVRKNLELVQVSKNDTSLVFVCCV